MSNSVVIRGHGPHVRFKTSHPSGGQVRVITKNHVSKVRLGKSTDLTFRGR